MTGLDKCKCVNCPECDGTGTVWFSFGYSGGQVTYLGRGRRDDLDEMETCHQCGGRGISAMCESCAEEECDG